MMSRGKSIFKNLAVFLKVLSCFLCCFLIVVSAPAQEQANPLQDLNNSLQNLAQDLGPAVVQIFATGYGAAANPDSTGPGRIATRRATGSGVIVHPEGYIVTTAHLIAGAQRVRVLFALPNEVAAASGSIVRPPGRLLDAEVLGYDLESDIAVLKIGTKVLRYLKFGNSGQIRRGQLVFTLGNSLQTEEAFSMGIVSSRAKQLTPDSPMTFVQTDAVINPGNSGGPLVDIQGNIVGINNYQASRDAGDDGFGLAAPSNIVQAVYEQIRENGRVRRGIIGVSVQTINPVMAESLKLPQNWGVMVSDVLPNSPADMSGIHPGDIILRLDETVIENAREFNINIYQRELGDDVSLEILRKSEKKTVKTVVFEKPEIPTRLSQILDKAHTPVPKLGILAADIDPDSMETFFFFRDSQGALIAELMPGSLSEGNLAPGDLIHAVDTVEIKSLEDLRTELDGRKSGDIVYLYIERQLQYRYVIVELQ